MAKSELELVVDDREPAELVEQLRAAGIRVTVERLGSADFVITDPEGKTWGLERKTTSDFANSWWENRLNQQLAQMSEDYDHALILYEDNGGFIGGHQAEFKLRRHLTTLNFTFPVLFCQGRRDLIHTMKYYTQKIRAGGIHTIRVKPKIVKLSSDVAKLYHTFPGVGLQRAEALAERFPKVIDLVYEMLFHPNGKWAADVDGLGKKTAMGIENLIMEGLTKKRDAPKPADSNRNTVRTSRRRG